MAYPAALDDGSVVIHVRYADGNYEFYEKVLRDGEHYITVEKPEDIPAVIEELEADPARAARIAQNGQTLMGKMDLDEVLRFMHQYFTEYAKLQTFDVKPSKGSVAVTCEDDLYRHYHLVQYIHGDNSSCISPPPGPYLAPGYGGSYKGPGVLCEVEGPPEYPHEFCAPECKDMNKLGVACEAGRGGAGL
ncbi:hypothetical protein CYMTET_20313 [Cymbomonas tetramitiformis]|uniref:Glycosyl transferase CAP10 domain-containing protein n=1 Tax=Cymbomonas tetramitiformis TaxID=36881 RepID=A0AAE0G4D1_9CHLO|nr:hypothetical protein CYMTET_20313 [Cymbomonas tetramitiformis]